MWTEAKLFLYPFWEADANKIFIHFLLLLILFDFPFIFIHENFNLYRNRIVTNYYASMPHNSYLVDPLEYCPSMLRFVKGVTWYWCWAVDIVVDTSSGMCRDFWRHLGILLLSYQTYKYLCRVVAHWDLIPDLWYWGPDPMVKPAHFDPLWLDRFQF